MRYNGGQSWENMSENGTIHAYRMAEWNESVMVERWVSSVTDDVQVGYHFWVPERRLYVTDGYIGQLLRLMQYHFYYDEEQRIL